MSALTSRTDVVPAPDLVAASAAARVRVARDWAERPSGDALTLAVRAGFVRLSDALTIALTGVALYVPYVGVDARVWDYAVWIGLVALGAVSAFQSLRAYSLAALRRPMSRLFPMAGAWSALFLASFAVLFFFKIGPDVSRVFALAWFVVGFAALVGLRFAYARHFDALVARGRLVKRAVVVGGGEFGRTFVREILDGDPDEVRLLGVFDDRNDSRASAEVEGMPMLGTVDDLVEFARTTRVDLVIFALPITAEDRLLQMLRKLWVLPIDIRLAAHANRLRFRPRSYSYVADVPMLDIYDRPIADWDVVVKYLFDKVVGAAALFVLSPILFLAALAVKMDSPGPILFRQKRHGFNNELIEVFKFRSMYVDRTDADAARLVTRGDPRVTRVGRFIRRTSIDELPQLLNVVFKGDLSLVGPRPHALEARAADRRYDEAVDGYFARHRVKPGVTGWAQIHGWRGETDTEEKIQRRVEYDLHYIENWSLWLDLYILAATPLALLRSDNAY